MIKKYMYKYMSSWCDCWGGFCSFVYKVLAVLSLAGGFWWGDEVWYMTAVVFGLLSLSVNCSSYCTDSSCVSESGEGTDWQNHGDPKSSRRRIK